MSLFLFVFGFAVPIVENGAIVKGLRKRDLESRSGHAYHPGQHKISKRYHGDVLKT